MSVPWSTLAVHTHSAILQRLITHPRLYTTLLLFPPLSPHSPPPPPPLHLACLTVHAIITSRHVFLPSRGCSATCEHPKTNHDTSTRSTRYARNGRRRGTTSAWNDGTSPRRVWATARNECVRGRHVGAEGTQRSRHPRRPLSGGRRRDPVSVFIRAKG